MTSTLCRVLRPVLVMYAGRILEDIPGARAEARQHPTRARCSTACRVWTGRWRCFAVPLRDPAWLDGPTIRGINLMTAVADERSILETVGLRVTFGTGLLSTVAVDDVSFMIARGEAFGLIGESGCGNRRFCARSAGLVRSYDGALLFANKELPHKPRQGVLPQSADGVSGSLCSLHPRKMVESVLASRWPPRL